MLDELYRKGFSSEHCARLLLAKSYFRFCVLYDEKTLTEFYELIQHSDFSKDEKLFIYGLLPSVDIT